MIAFLLSNNLVAQSDYLEASTTTEDELTDGQKDFRQKLLDGDLYLSSESIEISNFQDYLIGDEFSLKIPGLSGDFMVKKDREEVNPSPYVDYLWAGKIENEYPGYFLIGQKNGLTAGFIQTKEKYFTILPVGEGKAFIFEANNAKHNEKECGMPPTGEFNKQVEICNDVEPCTATIDALVLLPPEALTFFHDLGNPFISALALAISMETVNWGFLNSGITNQRIRYNIEAFDFEFAIPVNHSIDLNNLEANNSAFALRNQYRADIVIMMTDQDYPSVRGTAFAYPFSLEKPFAIVEVDHLFGPTWTFAHEITHLFGARHNHTSNGGNDSSDECNHGLRFDDGDGVEQRTIHAVILNDALDDGAMRILNFSNPEIEFNGVPTGTEDADNAKVIDNTGCEVAALKPAPILDVKISVPSWVCKSDGNFTAIANVLSPNPGLPGQPPYTFEWNASLVSGCAPTISPDGDNLSVDFTCFSISDGAINVEVTVIADDGTTAYDSKIVNIETNCLVSVDDRSNENIVDLNIIQQDLLIYPNPVKQLLTIQAPSDLDNAVLEIFNLDSKKFFEKTISEEELVKINTNQYSNGLYVVKIKSGNLVLEQKFVKTN